MNNDRRILHRFMLTVLAVTMLSLSALPYLYAQAPSSTYSLNSLSSSDRDEVNRVLGKYGYSFEDLITLGIDASDPQSAIQRARQLGIPQSDINSILQIVSRSRTTAIASDSLLAIPDSSDMEAVDQQLGLEVMTKTVPSVEVDTMAVNDSIKPAPVDSMFETAGRFAGNRYFGYDLLRRGEGNFAAMTRGPADPGYVVGTGDILRLYVWGDVELQYELTVDGSGNIVVPGFGQLFVGGTKLEDLQTRLVTTLSRQYSGLRKSPPTTFLDVSLARVRASEIYLMGDVIRPGNYTLPGFATTFNLMYATGGPKTSGSLREIRILRDGKIFKKVDLYDYLAKGDPSVDPSLRNGDIVFVPPRLNTVSVTGEVQRPAIYEFKPGETLKDLIAIAGGTRASAYSFRVQIDRILPQEERKPDAPDRQVLDFSLMDVMSGRQEVQLADGDMVYIFPYTNELKNYVVVTGGGITRPGRYQLDQIKRVSDLVNAADGLTDDAWPLKADLLRVQPDRTRKMVSLNLSMALDGEPSQNLLLQPEDTLRVYGQLEWRKTPKVSLRGFVRDPGEYTLLESMSLYDLIFEHAGLQDSLRFQQTFMDRGDIYRLTNDGKTRKRISFNLGDVWKKQDLEPIELKHLDIVILYKNDLTKLFNRIVSLSGAVKRPGDYDVAENMTLADLIALGGGFTEQAWVLEAEISRIRPGGLGEGLLAEIIRVPLVDWNADLDDPEKAVPDLMRNNTEAAKFVLQPYDQVRIRSNPDYQLPRNVTLIGELTFPGEYTIQRVNETLSEIINRAGGLLPTAHIDGGQLLRNDRRLFLDFRTLLEKNDKREDVELQPGDVIIIPPKPNTVSVLGEVVNPGLYKFIEGKRAKDYISEAGGFTRKGDRAILTQPSGRAYEISWRKNPKVGDGANIRVLSKPEVENKPIDWTEVAKESMTVISSALTIIVLATRLN